MSTILGWDAEDRPSNSTFRVKPWVFRQGAAGDPRINFEDFTPGPYPLGEIVAVQAGSRFPATIVTWRDPEQDFQITCPGASGLAAFLIIPPFAVGIEAQHGYVCGPAAVFFA